MAGSWGERTDRTGGLTGSLNRPIGLGKQFTADADDASIPADEQIEGVSGWLCGIDVEFDGTTPPDALVVVIKTIGGITLVTSAELAASGRVAVEPPVPFAGGLKILCTENTTNGAKANVIPLVE